MTTPSATPTTPSKIGLMAPLSSHSIVLAHSSLSVGPRVAAKMASG